MQALNEQYEMNADPIIAKYAPDDADYQKAKAGTCPFK
jgi:hypothetical protein